MFVINFILVCFLILSSVEVMVCVNGQSVIITGPYDASARERDSLGTTRTWTGESQSVQTET